MIAAMLRRLLLVTLITLPAFATDYQVVVKSSGKVIHGAFLYEDATTITLQINSAEVSFKKDKLDLERMRELNKPQPMTLPSSGSGASFGDKYQATLADELRHRENSLATARKFVADCRAGRLKCTEND